VEANYYQEMTGRTAGKHDMPIYTALGLGGEAGEVLDLTKKWLYHQHPYDPSKFLDELGDVMWYVSQCAASHGLLLSDIMQHNLDKLKKRYPEGFTSEKSINRKE
jgi:NTP pyrophosphatase (non-canonical NTP hydrolase)